MNSVNIPVTPGPRPRLISYSGSEIDDASMIIGLQEAAGCCGIPPATFVEQYSSFFCTDHHAADCDSCDPTFQPESAECSFSRSSGCYTITSHFSPLGVDACSQPDWLYGAEAYPSNQASLSLPSSWSHNSQHPCQHALSSHEIHNMHEQLHPGSSIPAASALPSWAVNHSHSSLASFTSHCSSSDSSSQASIGTGGGVLNSRFFAEWMQEGRSRVGLRIRDPRTGIDQRYSNDGSCNGEGSAVGGQDESAVPLSGHSRVQQR